MKIAYPVRVWPEDSGFAIQGLAPMDNVITYGDTPEAAVQNGVEALTGILETLLDNRLPIPDPPEEAEPGAIWIEPEPSAAIPILLRRARETAGLPQMEMASRLHVSCQAVQKWERPGANPTLATIQRVLRALGRRWNSIWSESGQSGSSTAIGARPLVARGGSILEFVNMG